MNAAMDMDIDQAEAILRVEVGTKCWSSGSDT
jgi:hypothetical protein